MGVSEWEGFHCRIASLISKRMLSVLTDGIQRRCPKTHVGAANSRPIETPRNWKKVWQNRTVYEIAKPFLHLGLCRTGG